MIWSYLVSSAAAFTLQDAWTAAEDGPDLRAIAAQEERSAAATGAARAAILPKVALNARYTVADEPIEFDLGGVLPPEVLAAIGGAPDPIVVQQQSWGEASATLVVPVVDADAWWTLRAASRAADAAGHDVSAVRRSLRLGIARAFYGARAAREGEEVAAEALTVARTQEDVARRRVEAGDAPPRTLLEAEQGRLSAERDALAAEEQRIRAEAVLHRLTGLPDRDPLDDGGPVDVAPRREPDAARARADAARTALAAQRLGWLPDVAGRLTTQWTENQGFAPDRTFVYAGVDASWTFDGGYRASRVRDAGAAVLAAEALAEAAERQVVEDRVVARASLARAASAAVAAEREQAVAEARWTEAELAFAEGAIPFADLERAALGRTSAAAAASRERLARALAEVEVALAGQP